MRHIASTKPQTQVFAKKVKPFTLLCNDANFARVKKLILSCRNLPTFVDKNNVDAFIKKYNGFSFSFNEIIVFFETLIAGKPSYYEMKKYIYFISCEALRPSLAKNDETVKAIVSEKVKKVVTNKLGNAR
ncbi:MAG: hypothetical protein IJ638_00695 [Alphaproteobacteria bacterium]|nr:hypothetical protein [Alphaproteobacteria bacterium]